MIRETLAGPFAFLVRDPKVDESCKIVHHFVINCIERAERSEKKQEENDNRILIYDLLDVIVDRETLRNELMHVFFSASDTTSSLLINAMFLMARNPEEWLKLREAVRDLHVDALTFNNLKKIDYLQWALKEGEYYMRRCYEMQ